MAAPGLSSRKKLYAHCEMLLDGLLGNLKAAQAACQDPHGSFEQESWRQRLRHGRADYVSASSGPDSS